MPACSTKSFIYCQPTVQEIKSYLVPPGSADFKYNKKTDHRFLMKTEPE